MPARLRFLVLGPQPPTPYYYATCLQRVAMDWLDAARSGRGQQIHDSNHISPVSVSPLWSNRGVLCFELGLLDDELTEHLERAASAASTLNLYGTEYTLGRPERIASASWDALLAGPVYDRFRFRVLSPMAFHASDDKGDRADSSQEEEGDTSNTEVAGSRLRKALPLPLPEQMFANWFEHWNRSCSRKMDPAVKQAALAHLAISSFEGKTVTIRLPRGRKKDEDRADTRPLPFTGFEGSMHCVVLKPGRVQQHLRDLTALARLAEFCGTGVNALRGMGQVAWDMPDPILMP